MNGKAQAALEYLITYGWTLVLVAAVIGVLVFIVGSPASGVSFSSSDPTKILIKGGSVSGVTTQLRLHNVTGGKMRVTRVSAGGYSGCSFNEASISSISSSSPVEVSAGSEMYVECSGLSGGGGGTFTVQYTDFAGLSRVAIITGSGAGPSPVTAGLVGLWLANGDASDSSGRGHDGTWFGTPAYAAGVEGQAFDFAGISTQGIEVFDHADFDLTTGVTLAAWVNRDSYSGHHKVVIKPYDMFNNNPWELYSLDYKGVSPGYPCFLISEGILDGGNEGACASGTFAPLGEWHHIAGTYNGNIMKIYHDGEHQPAGDNATTITIGTNDESFYINGVLGQSFHIDGRTDDVKVYNRALSDTEICTICNEFKPPSATCNC